MRLFGSVILELEASTGLGSKDIPKVFRRGSEPRALSRKLERLILELDGLFPAG